MKRNQRQNSKQMVYLALTGQEEYWGVNKPIMFLGSWCLDYEKRSSWCTLNGTMMPSPFSSAKEAENAYDEVDDIYEKILPLVVKSLNEIHGLTYSLRFWRIVIGPWLQNYISVVYDRYTHVKRAIELYPNFTTTVVSKQSYITPASSLDFACRVFEDGYNLQLYSRIFSFLGFSFPEVDDESPATNKLYKRLTKQTWKHRAMRIATKIYVRITDVCCPRRVVFRSTYFPMHSELQVMRNSSDKILIVKDRETEPLEEQYDEALRSNVKVNIIEGDEFIACVSQLLPFDIPKCFIEGFDETCGLAKKKYPKKAMVIFSANAWYYDEIFKVWSAKRAEQGATLLGTQHGGNYGALKRMASAKHEMTIVDKYYSWGWKNEENKAEVLPMPATKLMQLQPTGANNQKEGVLWVATTVPRYVMQFPNVPYYFQCYLEMQLTFLKALPSGVVSKLYFRAHYQDNGWGVVSRLQELDATLKVDELNVPFRESLERCRLYVCDHLSTTFIEALAANKPTILFWDSSTNVLRAEAKPYFNLLREQGILFDTPEAAAEAVSYVYDDVELWWDNIERQRAVQDFCSHFAQTSTNETSIWVDEIHRVATQAKM